MSLEPPNRQTDVKDTQINDDWSLSDIDDKGDEESRPILKKSTKEHYSEWCQKDGKPRFLENQEELKDADNMLSMMMMTRTKWQGRDPMQPNVSKQSYMEKLNAH